MMRDNTAGTEAVLGAARDAGCRVAVHVSSTVALARPGGVTLDHRSPLGPGHGPYSDSKVASERIARRMQEAGDPVTIVNPGGVIGPHDPYLGETNEILVQVLNGKQPVFPRGRQQFVDVRDVAAVIVAALGHAAGRALPVPGHDFDVPHEALRRVTGRRLPVRTLPAGLVAGLAMPGYLTGWSFLPGSVEGVRHQLVRQLRGRLADDRRPRRDRAGTGRGTDRHRALARGGGSPAGEAGRAGRGVGRAGKASS